MKFLNRSAADDALLLATFGPPEAPGANTCPSNILADEAHPDSLRFALAAITGRFAR